MPTSYFTLLLRRQLPILALAFVILGATGFVKWQATLMPEDTSIPTPVMPSPNARDYLTAAAALMRDKNAFLWASIRPPKSSISLSSAQKANWTSGYHIFTAAEKNKIVAENMPAITKLREGLKYPYMAPQVRTSKAGDGDLDAAWDMMWLFVLDGETRAAKGDWGSAMSAYLDALNIGCDIQVGEDMAFKPIWRAMNHLSAAQADAAARHLARIDADEATPAQMLRDQKWKTQAYLLQLLRQRRWRSTFYLPPETGGAYASSNFELAMESPRTAYDNCSRFADAWITNVQMPWPQAYAARRSFPTDPVNDALNFQLNATTVTAFINIALDRLLEVQLALRAYRVDHGHYPSSLTALVPSYLPMMPLDPFSDRQPLQYRLKGGAYLLYSIGPDAVDDGGKPIVDSSYQTRSYFLSASSGDPGVTGDIVAGVNY